MYGCQPLVGIAAITALMVATIASIFAFVPGSEMLATDSSCDRSASMVEST